VGNIAVQGTESRNNAFSFLMPVSEDYANIPFVLRVHWQDTSIIRNITIRVKLPKVTADSYVTMVNNVETVSLNPGDQVEFKLSNKNIGHAAVTNGSVDLTCNYSGVSVLSNLANISGMEPNTVENNTFMVSIADTVPAKSLVRFYWHTYYDNIHQIDTILVMVGADFESFESGDFSHYDWTMNNYPWVIASSGAYTGQNCARSAQNLPNNSQSRMSITTSTTEAAELSYYRKVSSESGYDFFKLFIDNHQEDEASGNEGWSYFSTMLPAGTHTIVFSYEKDYSASSGSDCAWIDNVMLPCTGIMVIEDLADTTNVGVENFEVTRVTVYPNPTSEFVSVQSEQPAQNVTLFDLNGRVVKSVNLSGTNSYQLNMNDVPAGFYLLQVTFDAQQVRNFKIIKK
jgi:hypothetical protein